MSEHIYLQPLETIKQLMAEKLGLLATEQTVQPASITYFSSYEEYPDLPETRRI